MKIAIQGHLTRGKEVIEILESLGGRNSKNWHGCDEIRDGFFVDNDGIIRFDDLPKGYKLYTLEEFEKEFPFKIGDKVITNDDHIGVIEKLIPEDISAYCVKINNNKDYWCTPSSLTLYKRMREERNITLTLDKAKEWYDKGGELKEVALQAYSEEELTKIELPKSWAEFCMNYRKHSGEAYISNVSSISEYSSESLRQINMDKNVCPSKKSAEAHLAMMQLEQLRDCWRQGWIPKAHESTYTIKFSHQGLWVYQFCSREFLSFPTFEMAKEFLECFRDLIEKARDLI